MRKLRAREFDSGLQAPTTAADMAQQAAIAAKASGSRLTPVLVYVPHADVKAIQLTAERFRKIARIPESEVPSD